MKEELINQIEKSIKLQRDIREYTFPKLSSFYLDLYCIQSIDNQIVIMEALKYLLEKDER